MSGCSRLCTLVLRLHAYAFFVVVTAQFLVGLYTESVLERILASYDGWVLRDVIVWHKWVGNGLALAAVAMLAQKVWLTVAKPPRPALPSGSWSALVIRQHWWLLGALFPAQYLTTVMAGDVAKLLGVQQGSVFAAHWYIACLIMLLSASLLAQKLFFLPNSVFFGRASQKKPAKSS